MAERTRRIDLTALKAGDRLPDRVCGPISRTTLALFAGASGDHNPIHLDLDFARQAGMPDVFAHGMLSMAYLAQLVTGIARQELLRELSVRFVSITPVHATVVCSGKVIESIEHEGERRLRLSLEARVRGGEQTISGEAVLALP